MSRKTILTFVGVYLPGFKGGGPIRSLANMVEQIGSEFAFRVVTADRDLGDLAPYPGIHPDRWTPIGQASVRYLPLDQRSLRRLYDLMRSTPHDVVYLHSFFSPVYTVQPLLLRKLGLVQRKPVVLAPRGEFSSGALAIKAGKKRFFIALARLLGLYRDVIWQATSENERQDIERVFGEGVPIVLAPNLSSKAQFVDLAKKPVKEKGTLRLLFLSRVSRKKNLDGALRLLAEISGSVKFDVYGPIEDLPYWKECEEIIAGLPSNILVTYCGPIPHDQVQTVMATYHSLLFPTHGENFGHVIVEAWLAGCPVILSDQTPWRNLQELGVGWDIPLGRPQEYRSAIQTLVDMDDTALREAAQRAQTYGLSRSHDSEALDRSRELLWSVLSDSPPHLGRP